MSQSSSAKAFPLPLAKGPSVANDDSQNAERSIEDRRSRELIIGLCGAIGSGVKELYEVLQDVLSSSGYKVYHIRLSKLIIAAQSSSEERERLEALVGFERYCTLQDLGDNLRHHNSESIIAKYAIKHIKNLRDKDFTDPTTPGNTKTQAKVAYIIDQLKNPSEVDLFRQVYRNNFYLVGIISTPSQRINTLNADGIEKNKIGELIERDRRGIDDYQQQVEDTLQRSDFFIKNTNQNALKNAVERLNKLIHGIGNITPKMDETGMYHAYSASLRSACLSRQVGASIMNPAGEIISTGCNDVPRFGGGLYTSDSKDDRRCYNEVGAKCHNDKHKNILKGEIEKILKTFDIKDPISIAQEIVKKTKIKYLIEYSRAVHAEMDAITTLSRSPNVGSVGAILYCTTYPCHNCAKHIVASGIKRVIYIEPYEKSLALDLHEDAIEFYHGASGDDASQSGKVHFEVFEGVSPNRYVQFFRLNQPRKSKDGLAIKISVIDAYHVDTQQLDSYVDYEGRVVQEVDFQLKNNENNSNLEAEIEV
ncbi:anti-phage dCTP deaminase [Yersinia enterocolitica]|uniref:anti-phage dCTP deaminase n=1 Tax=Yersinia enterocolitica TaxID=630 RepID=UPI0028B94CD7|nr:deoxycytidylate deaminase [Yersinia enterocolitica]EKN4195084.1 deoxycytidylate deaminase [Yersinia enterocolitica]EKN4900077.1 deoxycytidylate deaminase [Yersinia enterocolitica]EKN6253631.1 deoxycytidylate deaminase [Yersinia enterocolitica]ELI8129220.1 deoxycytidylate deaminase [Yersinia enterocolitica]